MKLTKLNEADWPNPAVKSFRVPAVRFSHLTLWEKFGEDSLSLKDRELKVSNSGGKYGISRGTFFQGIEIVALTTVRATI